MLLIASFYRVKCFSRLVKRRSRHSQGCALCIALKCSVCETKMLTRALAVPQTSVLRKVRALSSSDAGPDSDVLIAKAGWEIRRERRTKMKCRWKNDLACGSRAKLWHLPVYKSCLFTSSCWFILHVILLCHWDSSVLGWYVVNS